MNRPPDVLPAASGLSDALSDVLQGARLRGWVAAETLLPPLWALRVDGGPARFYLLREGRASIQIDGEEGVVHLAPGDLAVVMPERPHRLAADLTGKAIPPEQFVAIEEVAALSGVGLDGDTTRLVCGGFHFDEHTGFPLRSSLPAVIQVKGSDGKPLPWLTETLRLLMRESDPSQPGCQAVVDHLAQVIFIQAVRACIPAMSADRDRWLAAIADPDIALAAGLMHSQPELPWTVTSLADRVCLSRSVFAARFKALLSKPPHQYLLECRMRKACDLLARSRKGVKEIAVSVGYETAAAFSNTFKRWCGIAPAIYRRQVVSTHAAPARGSS